MIGMGMMMDVILMKMIDMETTMDTTIMLMSGIQAEKVQRRYQLQAGGY